MNVIKENSASRLEKLEVESASLKVHSHHAQISHQIAHTEGASDREMAGRDRQRERREQIK